MLPATLFRSLSPRAVPGLVALGLAALLPAGAQATGVCAWLVETNAPEDVHELAVWLEADQDVEFFYQIAGEGVSSEGSRSHSPGSGTYSLTAGRAEKPWGFGATLSPPGEIDIVIELHKKPASIFSDEPTPLLASFTFHRHVPEGEAKAPPILATRQCQTLAAD